MIDMKGRLKLADFGLAWKGDLVGGEKCHSSSGTHGYTAPEVYMNDKSHDDRADVFAAGITIHEFGTGMRPYLEKSHKNASAISASRISASEGSFGDPIKLWHDSDEATKVTFPPEMRLLVRACLKMNPDRRICASEMKQSAWFSKYNFDAGDPDLGKPPYTPSQEFNADLGVILHHMSRTDGEAGMGGLEALEGFVAEEDDEDFEEDSEEFMQFSYNTRIEQRKRSSKIAVTANQTHLRRGSEEKHTRYELSTDRGSLFLDNLSEADKKILEQLRKYDSDIDEEEERLLENGSVQSDDERPAVG